MAELTPEERERIYREEAAKRTPDRPVAGGRPLNVGGLWVAGAGLLAVLGSFLPWMKVIAPFVGEITRSGMDGGDGIFTLGMGVVLIFVGWSWASSGAGALRAVSVVVSVLLGALTLFEYINLKNGFDEARASSDLVVPSHGVGLYALALAAIIGIAAPTLKSAGAGQRATGVRPAGLAKAGWYSDPAGRWVERWWDGTLWTGRVRGKDGESYDEIGKR